MNHKKKVLVFIMGLSLSVILFGQNIDSLLRVMELHLNEDKSGSMISKSPQYLYASFQFQDKSLFLGRPSDSSSTNINAQISYYRSGLFFNVSGQYYENFIPGSFNIGLMAGYSKILFRSPFKAQVSYSYFYYPDADSSSQMFNTQSFSMGLKYKKNNLGAFLSYMLIPGHNDQSQLSSGVYYSRELWKFDNKFVINMDPECALFFGTESAAVYLGHGQYTVMEYNDIFSLLDLEIRIPITLIWKNYDMQVSYAIHFPFSMISIMDLSPQSQLTINMGYIFSF